MFTGLVSDVGTIRSVEARGELRRIRIACYFSRDPFEATLTYMELSRVRACVEL